MPISRRLVGDALAARLVGVTPATIGYYGAIGRPLTAAVASSTPTDPPPKSATDPRVVPYFILYPGAGGEGPDPSLCRVTPEGLVFTPRITAAAGDVEDLLALIDRIDGRLVGWTPTLAGVAFPGPVRRLPGYEPTILTGQSTTPTRVYTLLQYQLTTPEE